MEGAREGGRERAKGEKTIIDFDYWPNIMAW